MLASAQAGMQSGDVYVTANQHYSYLSPSTMCEANTTLSVNEVAVMIMQLLQSDWCHRYSSSAKLQRFPRPYFFGEGGVIIVILKKNDFIMTFRLIR